MSAAHLPVPDYDPVTTHPPPFLSLALHPVPAVGDESTTGTRMEPPNVADPFSDLLAYLDRPRRLGMISWIATRYYDGWRPDRAEIADLVGVELGVLRFEEAVDRRRHRAAGAPVPDIVPRIQDRIAARKPESAEHVPTRWATLRSVDPTSAK